MAERSKFQTLVRGAAIAGQEQACLRELEHLSRSAGWHSSDRNRIDQKAFNSLRDHIDKAEALWNSAHPQSSEPAVEGE